MWRPPETLYAQQTIRSPVIGGYKISSLRHVTLRKVLLLCAATSLAELAATGAGGLYFMMSPNARKQFSRKVGEAKDWHEQYRHDVEKKADGWREWCDTSDLPLQSEQYPPEPLRRMLGSVQCESWIAATRGEERQKRIALALAIRMTEQGGSEQEFFVHQRSASPRLSAGFGISESWTKEGHALLRRAVQHLPAGSVEEDVSNVWDTAQGNTPKEKWQWAKDHLPAFTDTLLRLANRDAGEHFKEHGRSDQ